ncbi:MAG: UDP-N-acetylmuramoyl-tripeptide--D-alanyl-D-alanine ligase [Clostridia bacterium]|nr:UDP-N-acetylmuramoyl-tripeptide--D-alanyl-D-alanine ligase [Clostridia bacterium]
MKVDFGRKILNIKELAVMCGGKIAGEWDEESLTTPVCSVCTDSREASVGTCFAAIRGAKVDGHDYIARAGAGGCVCAIAERIPENAAALPLIVVEDTVKALGRLAGEYTRDSRAKKVAVTGSVGKTTTKEFIAAVLGASRKVYRTEGNFNSVIGMPLSLLAMPEDAEFAVFEMGMGAAGDVRQMTLAARPDVAVITNIGTAHMEFLGSRENIAKAKLEIAEGLKPDGVLLLCGGEPLLSGVYKTDKRARYFSADDLTADYRASCIRNDTAGTVFDAYCRGRVICDLEIPVIGKHNVAAAISAVAVGLTLGIDEEAIRRGLAAYHTVGLRQNIMAVGKYTVIADCYNASPESMRAACDVLGAVAGRTGGRRLALLGDMLELGEQSPEFHRTIGEYFARSGVDRIFTFGRRAEAIADGAAVIYADFAKDKILRQPDISNENAELLAKRINDEIKAGDVLLVKASRGVAAERVIEALRRLAVCGN